MKLFHNWIGSDLQLLDRQFILIDLRLNDWDSIPNCAKILFSPCEITFLRFLVQTCFCRNHIIDSWVMFPITFWIWKGNGNVRLDWWVIEKNTKKCNGRDNRLTLNYDYLMFGTKNEKILNPILFAGWKIRFRTVCSPKNLLLYRLDCIFSMEIWPDFGSFLSN